MENTSNSNEIHPLLAAHDMRLKQKKQAQKHVSNRKNKTNKTNKRNNKDSCESFTYSMGLQNHFYGSKTMDQCKHCLFSNNCNDMPTIQCDTCGDYTHFDCTEAIKAGENKTQFSWNEYCVNKQLAFDCVDCRKIKQNINIDKNDKIEFAKTQAAARKDIDFDSVDDCILWIKNQCLQFIRLSIKLHQKYIIDRTPPIFHKLSDTWAFTNQKNTINEFKNGTKTMEDVKTRGLDTFLELLDLHNQEYDNVKIDRDIGAKQFQLLNLITLELCTNMIDFDGKRQSKF